MEGTSRALGISSRSSNNQNSFGIHLLEEPKKQVLNKQIDNDILDIQNDNKPRELHVKGFNKTHWAAHIKAVKTLIRNFELL